MINNLVILLTHIAIILILARAVMLDRGWMKPATRGGGPAPVEPGKGWRARARARGR